MKKLKNVPQNIFIGSLQPRFLIFLTFNYLFLIIIITFSKLFNYNKSNRYLNKKYLLRKGLQLLLLNQII